MFYITIGIFNNCIFNSPIVLELLYSNNMGDIQFNNCTFNEISYLNNGELNSNRCCGIDLANPIPYGVYYILINLPSGKASELTVVRKS